MSEKKSVDPKNCKSCQCFQPCSRCCDPSAQIPPWGLRHSLSPWPGIAKSEKTNKQTNSQLPQGHTPSLGANFIQWPVKVGVESLVPLSQGRITTLKGHPSFRAPWEISWDLCCVCSTVYPHLVLLPSLPRRLWSPENDSEFTSYTISYTLSSGSVSFLGTGFKQTVTKYRRYYKLGKHKDHECKQLKYERSGKYLPWNIVLAAVNWDTMKGGQRETVTGKAH